MSINHLRLNDFQHTKRAPIEEPRVKTNTKSRKFDTIITNNQKIRETRSHVSKPELAAVTSDPKPIMWDQDDRSFLTVVHQVGLRSQVIHEQKELLETTPKSDTETSVQADHQTRLPTGR